jgi:hypothetical protein
MDPELYNKCEQEYEQSCLNQQNELDERRHRWELLQQAASKLKNPTYYTNHVDSRVPRQERMQIDPSSLVHVPERIPEEEYEHQSTEDTNMRVDLVDLASPAMA